MATQTVPKQHQAASAPTAGSSAAWLVLAGLLLAHVVAVFTLIPLPELLDTTPIYGADHPAHAHRVYAYRAAAREGGFPWGYDPAVCGGVVMRPTQDAGAKPQQVLGWLLPFLTEGQVIRWFLFFTALTMPLWVLLAARLLRFPLGAAVWIAAMLLGGAWLYSSFEGFLLWGLAAFAFASYLAPLVLALFLRFVEQPTWWRYAAATLGLGAVALLHVLGPVLIAPVLAFYALTARPLARRWRVAALLAPLVVLMLNAFWLVPFLADLRTPRPPDRSFTTYPEDLVYVSWEHLLAMLSPARVVAATGALACGSYGLWRMRHWSGTRAAVAFGAAAFLGVFLKLFGSFLPVVVTMQPSRYLLGAFALLTLPVGLALYELTRKVRLPNAPVAAACAVAMVALAGWQHGSAAGAGRDHVNFAGHVEREMPRFLALPISVPAPKLVEPLAEFVHTRTDPGDRLLVQTVVQCEPNIMAAAWGREVIGNAYPDQHDPANFLVDRLWGRKLEDWQPAELRRALERWGVSWVFTDSEQGARLVAVSCDDAGEPIGVYRAFRVPGWPGRFLVGTGEVVPAVNRMELSGLNAAHGLVVLRYRYHPAWRASGGVAVERYPVPEDPTGFIALRNPPGAVTLRFDAVGMFSARWPTTAQGE
jgi:hypothetical protein